MIQQAVVLFGHGARDPQWAEPMRGLKQRVEALMPTARVELAFLELMEPSLPQAVASLVEQGVDSLTVVPIFFGRGGHLKNDFPKIMDELKATHPNCSIAATTAVGQWDAVWAAMAEALVDELTAGR